MENFKLGDVTVEDTFAEAFPMKATRLIITADSHTWAKHAAISATGLATSVIACGCEAGIEKELSAEETPDNRPGVSILMFAVSGTELAKQLEKRVGQCMLTCATAAVFSGLDVANAEQLPMGARLRYFGDGFQISKVMGNKRYWRIPVMCGEFICEDTTAVVKAVGGGNLIVLGKSVKETLAACEEAVLAMCQVSGVIMPFPGGIVSSGSKVGSKYKALMASTNHPYCPTLRGRSDSMLSNEINCVLEIVIDGLTADAVGEAMKRGLLAISCSRAVGGIVRITAGNYGGRLGPFHFHLKELCRLH